MPPRVTDIIGDRVSQHLKKEAADAVSDKSLRATLTICVKKADGRAFGRLPLEVILRIEQLLHDSVSAEVFCLVFFYIIGSCVLGCHQAADVRIDQTFKASDLPASSRYLPGTHDGIAVVGPVRYSTEP